MRNRQRFFFSRLLLLAATLPLTIFPGSSCADSLMLVRIVDRIDLPRLSEELKDLKISAALRMDKNGDVILNCLNSFSFPIAHHAFDGKPRMQKLMERTSLQVDQKGKGVMVKLAFLF